MQRKFSHGVVLAVAALLSACASTPASFYTLSAPMAPVQSTDVAPTYIEVAPVTVPERLQRPQIVLRTDTAKVEILEQSRWSAPFNIELHDALAAGVANRLGGIEFGQGTRTGTPLYRIRVQLLQFDATRGGQVDAQFGWSITRSDQDGSITSCHLSAQEAVGGPGVAEVVQAMQRIVSKTAEAIAADVQTLRAGSAGRCSR